MIKAKWKAASKSRRDLSASKFGLDTVEVMEWLLTRTV